jgi:hypothetical protein
MGNSINISAFRLYRVLPTVVYAFMEQTSLLLVFKTGSGAQPTSYTLAYRGLNRTGREADHLPAVNAVVKKT